MKKIKLLKILPAILSLLLVGCNNNSPSQPADKEMYFYYINDTHGAFKRQNTDTNYNEAGMAYISTYLKEQAAKRPNNTILLSGGDMFQGGFESNATEGLIMVDTINEIGFDAMVLGNHEFDWGEEKLVTIAENLECPIISCNTFYRGTENLPDYVSPYTIIEKDDLKIGIIGAANMNMNESISGSISQNFSFPDPVPYVKKYSRQLRVEEKCDLVIAAFHDGGFNGNNFYFRSLCENDSATKKEYVDGIFLAHDHRYKNGYYLGVPYIESGCNGRYIGTMKFQFTLKDGVYDLTGSWAENTAAYRACLVEDTAITALLEKYKDAINAGDKVIYNFKHDYTREEFAMVICEAMYWYINMNISSFGGHQIYFTSHNPGGVRVAVSKGEMTLSQLITAVPFDNNIYIQKCTADNLQYMRDLPSNYICYEPNEIVFEDGYTYAATIAYLAEKEEYGKYIQVEATEYQITAKEILIEYLTLNINENL